MTGIPFEVRSSTAGDAVIVAVTGEIDLATAPALADALDAVPNGGNRVVVDLAAVTFLDSSGLNALVRCQRDLAERGISLAVVSPADQTIRRVFEITKLTETLGVVDSLGAALGSTSHTA